MTRARTKAVLDDSFLPLDELATYSGLSRRTLEDYLQDPTHPLPCYRFGGAVRVKRSEFDDWARQYRDAKAPVDIRAIVDTEIGR